MTVVRNSRGSPLCSSSKARRAGSCWKTCGDGDGDGGGESCSSSSSSGGFSDSGGSSVSSEGSDSAEQLPYYKLVVPHNQSVRVPSEVNCLHSQGRILPEPQRSS